MKEQRLVYLSRVPPCLQLFDFSFIIRLMTSVSESLHANRFVCFFVWLQDFKPHIFIVAEEAYRNVQGHVEPVDQSLVVSGESGAGKVGGVKLCFFFNC